MTNKTLLLMLRSILSLQVKIELAKGEPFIIVKYYSGIIKIAKDGTRLFKSILR